jgi:hypothetical protein
MAMAITWSLGLGVAARTEFVVAEAHGARASILLLIGRRAMHRWKKAMLAAAAVQQAKEYVRAIVQLAVLIIAGLPPKQKEAARCLNRKSKYLA